MAGKGIFACVFILPFVNIDVLSSHLTILMTALPVPRSRYVFLPIYVDATAPCCAFHVLCMSSFALPVVLVGYTIHLQYMFPFECQNKRSRSLMLVAAPRSFSPVPFRLNPPHVDFQESVKKYRGSTWSQEICQLLSTMRLIVSHGKSS